MRNTLLCNNRLMSAVALGRVSDENMTGEARRNRDKLSRLKQPVRDLYHHARCTTREALSHPAARTHGPSDQ